MLSPIKPRWLVKGGCSALLRNHKSLERAHACIKSAFGAKSVVLTDSGTSALILAFGLAVPPGGSVGLPGYGCPNLVAAARFAGVRIRLYDLDPDTLSPDLGSVKEMLERGVHAVVVTHLYGYPADIHAVQALARDYNAIVIEDAAQSGGGKLAGIPLGGMGQLSVLSFGRGKGITSGQGGALLVHTNDLALNTSTLKKSAGWSVAATTSLQWSFGRPSLYKVPSSIPWLGIGETIYTPAKKPATITYFGASVLPQAQQESTGDLQIRSANASLLKKIARQSSTLHTVTSLPYSYPGYLRFPVLDMGNRRERPDLGIVRGYPKPIVNLKEMRFALHPGEPAPPGCEDISKLLFTLPVHRYVVKRDINRIGEWIACSN